MCLRNGERQVVAEGEMFPAYVDEYRDERMSLRFAELKNVRYLSSGTDVHGIPYLATQRHILSDDGCEDLWPEIPRDDEDWNFKGLVIVKELRVSGVREKFCEVQNPSETKKWKVSSSVIEIKEIAASVGFARKKRASREQSSAQMIADL